MHHRWPHIKNKFVFSLVNSAVNMALPAFAAERRAAAPLLLGARRLPLSIDISFPHDAQQQTRCTPLLISDSPNIFDASRPLFPGQTDRPLH